jgi:hypothetical protein
MRWTTAGVYFSCGRASRVRRRGRSTASRHRARGEPIPATDQSRLLAAFRDDAQAYCDFIDGWHDKGVREPFTNLLRLLSNLAKSGVAIPFDMAEKDVEYIERIDQARWRTIATEINEVTGLACAALVSEHADDEEAQVRASMLWDDLADIYRDLRHGLDLYTLGGSEHLAQAAWQWRFGYESHWGAHLFRALTTVHEIRFRRFME